VDPKKNWGDVEHPPAVAGGQACGGGSKGLSKRFSGRAWTGWETHHLDQYG